MVVAPRSHLIKPRVDVQVVPIRSILAWPGGTLALHSLRAQIVHGLALRVDIGCNKQLDCAELDADNQDVTLPWSSHVVMWDEATDTMLAQLIMASVSCSAGRCNFSICTDKAWGNGLPLQATALSYPGDVAFHGAPPVAAYSQTHRSNLIHV